MSSLNARLRRLEAALDAAAGPDPELLGRLAVYRDNPALFNEVVLGRTLWSKQVAVCGAVARSPVTIVPAGRAVGKSYLMAGLALWWLYTRRGSRVICTGPDHRQVVSVVFAELRKALALARERLPYQSITQGYGSPQRLAIDAESRWEVLGYAAKNEEGFSGQHAGELLVIVDEASGITEPIWHAIDGLAAARLVVAGNPIRYDCHFRELHDLAEEGRGQSIVTVPISSLESPDADKDESPVGLASGTFLRYMRFKHGDQSPWWRANILGKFPGAESVQFLPTAWLDACVDPAALTDEFWLDTPRGATWMGVDVGGGVGADKSVVVVRDGKQLLEVFASEWHGVLDDARDRLEPIVVDLAEKWRVPGHRIVFDQAGLGRSVKSYLATWGLTGVVGYFGGGSGGKFYVNRRSANAFALKNRLDPKREDHVPFYCGGIPEWPALRQELMELRGGLMDYDDGAVKEKIETKQELQARLHRSPDLLDALLMSFTYRTGD